MILKLNTRGSGENLVNLSLANRLEPIERGSVIHFSNGQTLIVAESVAEIWAMLNGTTLATQLATEAERQRISDAVRAAARNGSTE